jgi:hypothetical protein
MLSVDDLLFFVDESLDAMTTIVVELGDDLATRRPAIDGLNAPYVTLTHCVGVMEQWGGHVIAGRLVERDRDSEFRASGSVDELVERVRAARRQLALDLARFQPDAAPHGRVDDEDARLPIGASQGGALLHLYSELAIHRGHVEICRDILVSGAVATCDGAAATRPDGRYRDTSR